ncbi:response regulator [uncultured Alsobacter sp.]|uniref:response regulator n=1 Tax=uncultured Alsobacter sp. TaxID=1748258 RepID=UPI0025E83C54|nr:response regulator [uncultured Alsobacter sp.]
MRILIVDDSPINLMVLKGIVMKFDGVDVSTFSDPLAAIHACEETQYDVIVADYMMPGIDGIALVARLRAMPAYASLPIVMITTEDEKRTCIRALEAGATDYVTKPIEPVELKARLRNLMLLRDAQILAEDKATWLTQQIETATTLLKAREREMMARLNRVIDERDWEDADAADRMAEIASLIAAELGVGTDAVRDLRLGCTLFASGSLDLREPAPQPSAIPDSLTPVRIARSIAAGRDERFDGTGLPARLAGAAIPPEARIAAIALAYGGLVSDRVYGRGLAPEEARSIILAGSGSQFDPECIRAFERCWPAISAYVPGRHDDVRVA